VRVDDKHVFCTAKSVFEEDVMKAGNLQRLYVRQLRELYSAENQLMRSLPVLVEAASTPVLRAALAAHIEQTCTHVDRLEYIFRELKQSAEGGKSRGIEGILAESRDLLDIRNELDDAVLDAGLIAVAQRIEHYEIAAYGSACIFAEELEDYESAHFLRMTLDEECAAEQQLKNFALAKNPARVEEDDGVVLLGIRQARWL
jgi:ferritin-like metal-binding protein YciE